jgi:hypothetical protein
VFVSIVPADPYAYAYLLGAYLGDGYVAHIRRSFQLVITRAIVLAPWQREIVDAHPWPFVTVLPSGRVAQYAYPRYFFSNLSADIRGLFCASCEQLGLRWTQSNHRNISISHRASVALLDEHVGPKC